MSDSDTESEPEPSLTDTFSFSTVFAQACGSKPCQANVAPKSVNWATSTLATLDFGVLREDDSLHGVVQECVTAIVRFIDMLLLPQSTLSDQDRTMALKDISCLLPPSFLNLLFQYRRLFRTIAAKDLRLGFAAPTTVCWVDIILTKLGDLSALVATDFRVFSSEETLANVLVVRQREGRLKAAMQLADNWDLVPSLLTSDRTSPAAKRLAVQLLFGSYVLYPRISGTSVGRDFFPQSLPTALTEHILSIDRQMLEPMAVAGQGYQSLVEQERLVHAMVLTLLAVTSMSLRTDTETHSVTPFRPQTNSAIICLLNFVMDKDEFTLPTIFCPLEELNAASSMLVRFGVVPLWCLGVWEECQSPRADIFIHLATTYLRHHVEESNVFGTILSSQGSGSHSHYQHAVMTVLVELLTRCTIMLSASSSPAGSLPLVMDVLRETCLLARQSIVTGNCGAHHSIGYCKALLVLALQLCRMEQGSVVNNLVIQSLSFMHASCVCEVWKLIRGDSSIPFQTIIDEANAAVGVSLTQIPVEQNRLLQVQQLMQFLSIIISKDVDALDDQSSVRVAESVGKFLLDTSSGETTLLHETFLTFATIIRQRCPGYNNSQSSQVLDVEMMRHISSETRSLVVASAVSAYIMSAPLLEPCWYLGTWEYLSDTLMLMKAHPYQSEDEPLALAVGPTICDALLFLVNHIDNDTKSYVRASPKTVTLCETLEHLATSESGELSRHRMSQSANTLLTLLSNVEPQETHDPAVKTQSNLNYQAVLCEYRDAMRLILVLRTASEQSSLSATRP